ncbi:hypothetical protein GF337_03600 [candidate division KSB1 bacterium]|nr:hypothetical protein [candidate division KSB1 bacterium]
MDCKIYVKTFKLIIFLVCILFSKSFAQFYDDFGDTTLAHDPEAMSGWAFFTGDGDASMDFRQGDGYASICVDAARDKRNIWWALIRRYVSAEFDLKQLTIPDYELRIEARIRVSHAPRRVNLHLNTQRTTDFHSHLMEFDIPDTTSWHTISMTTSDFDARPGDRIFGQMALMDWGPEKYRVDLDYFKVDVVNVDSIGPDKGVAVSYHPPVPPTDTFDHHIPVAHDAMIDTEFPDMNFNHWFTMENEASVPLITVSGTQIVILRWDLTEFSGMVATGSGLLELKTHSIQRSSEHQKDFGMVRVVEILGGDPEWEQEDVTLNSFCQGKSLNEVLNSQMIIDIAANQNHGGKNLITISQPVLQRMIDGRTLGFALRPLGAINASFYALENKNAGLYARLHFDVEK